MGQQLAHNAASLLWNRAPVAAAITSYEYRHKLASGGDWSEWETFKGETVSGNTVRGSVPGLLHDVAYEIEVRAVNVVGAGEASDKVTVTPYEHPAKLTGLKAVVAGERKVTLSWITSAESSVTGYAYQRRLKKPTPVFWGRGYVVSGSVRQTTTVLVDQLNTGVPYEFRVWALHPRSSWDRSKNPPRPLAPGGIFEPTDIVTATPRALAGEAGEADPILRPRGAAAARSRCPGAMTRAARR